MRKKTKLSSNEDLVEEREELMVSPSSKNRVSLPHIQTSNTNSKRIKLSLLSSSPAVEELVDEREDFMVFPSENSPPSSSGKTQLLKAKLPLPPPDLKALSLSVSFHGSNLSKEAAWDEYNKPIEELTLFIPSHSATIPHVTSMFYGWGKKSYPQLQHSLKGKGVVESSETLKPRNIIGNAYDVTSASRSRKRTRRKRVCTMGHCQTHDNDDDDLSLTIAQIRRLSIKNCSDVTYGGEDASEPLGKKSRFEKGSEGNDEAGSRTWKDMVRSPNDENNSLDPTLGFDDATNILVSSLPEIRQICDDELDVLGSNVEKMTTNDDGNKEPEFLLHGEKGSLEKEDDSLIQKKIASNADNKEPTPCQNIASGGSEKSCESNSSNSVGDETQGHDCFVHDTVLGCEETMESSEQIEKRNEDVGGSDLIEKSLQNVKVMELSIEERIIKVQRNVAWLKARKATKQKKISAAR
ncbi:unnamed protein product [Eruca vesicaria subsp. sativa]|uniref:Uncharacterized protein n=1 Tax=Eruca vesicaria subsp. sativa TaxID=29727 RepID=A0ABC8IUT0_ERUVS|nr:unnamed protein product [Eruca vesicaria subsp. sativa]